MLERLGMDAVERERRLKFLRLDEADASRLRELSAFFESIVDGMIDEFYDHVLSFRETRVFLADPALVARLKQAQRVHFISLVGGDYGAEYFESRLAVGLAHARVGLQPEWYLGAYNIQLQYIMDRLFERFSDQPARVADYLASLHKLVALDVCLAMDAYIVGGYIDKPLAQAYEREAERAKQALAAAEREQERREQLISMVVHDIRSPVTAIMATARASLRKYRNPTETPGRQFALIEQTGGELLSIIDNILDIARMAQGPMPVQLEAFDVDALVADCVEQMRPFSEQSRHHLTFESNGPLAVASLDRTLVRRIVSNLIVNALRHTPPGVSVSVSCARSDDGFAVVTVCDDGPGVPSRVRDLVFGANDAATKTGHGIYVETGLGLRFCKLACQRLGGELQLVEPDGRGSRFVVQLPHR